MNPAFDCDPTKRLLVLATRRIDLLDTAGVFDDPRRLDFADVRSDYGEVRRITTGILDGRMLTVVYTVRDKVTWIITPWPASRRERARYREMER